MIIAQDLDDASYMMRKLIEEYVKWGLNINFKKTEYLTMNAERNDILDIEGRDLQKVEKISIFRINNRSRWIVKI